MGAQIVFHIVLPRRHGIHTRKAHHEVIELNAIGLGGILATNKRRGRNACQIAHVLREFKTAAQALIGRMERAEFVAFKRSDDELGQCVDRRGACVLIRRHFDSLTLAARFQKTRDKIVFVGRIYPA